MRRNYRSIYCALLILLLFPGFFFYHSGLANGVIPPVLGGFIAQVAAAAGLPFLVWFGYLLISRREQPIFADVAVFGFVLYATLWSTLFYLLGDDVQRSPTFYFYNVAALFVWLVLYLAMRDLRVEGKWLQRLLLVSLAAFLVIAAKYSNGQMFRAEEMVNASVPVAGYQEFARSAVIVALLLLANSRGLRSGLVMALAMPLLFLLGARSEFAGFLIAAALFMLISGQLTRLVVLYVPLVVLVGYIGINYFDVMGGDSRILELLDVKDATSYQAREVLMARALATIAQHPLLGNYAGQLYYGEIGDYAHNALQGWVSYGLPGFLAFSFLMAYSVLVPWNVHRREPVLQPEVATALLIGVYAAILAISAKTVNDPVFALAWGAAARVLLVRRDKAAAEAQREEEALDSLADDLPHIAQASGR